MEYKKLDVRFSPNFVSTLSDPSWSNTFADVKTAGLAAESLMRAVLGDRMLAGRVVKVTPQSANTSQGSRGSRVDVEVETDKNEIVLIEIQVKISYNLSHRNILAAAHNIGKRMPKGTKTAGIEKRMPKIVAIDITCFNVREDNGAIVQPVRLAFENPPQREANDRLAIYFVQLPQFLEEETDFSKPLHCWLYTIWQAHVRQITPKEVVDMQQGLKAYYDGDPGFRQYCDRFGFVAADPEVQEQYVQWLLDEMQRQDEIESAREEEREAWLRIVAEKELALVEKDSALAEKEAEIAVLRAQLLEKK